MPEIFNGNFPFSVLFASSFISVAETNASFSAEINSIGIFKFETFSEISNREEVAFR